MMIALIISIVLNLLLLGLLVFLRKQYKHLADYNRKVDTERIAMALELGELREEKDFIKFR